jgi:SpoIID/LytB domain protein
VRHHLFVKTFQMDESAARDAWLAERRAEGFQPEVFTLGKRLAAEGRTLDTRIDWISLASEPTAAAAELHRKQLVQRGFSPWIQAEVVAPGQGAVLVRGADGSAIASFDAPLSIAADGPVELAEVQSSYWGGKPRPLAFAGRIEVRIGAQGKLDAIEQLPIEEYLRGVLPAEMSPSWPADALKAQAVAARSDVAGGLGGRYALEGFDFFATERSRAYLGATGRAPETDEALRTTAGEILRQDGRVAPAVFSSNCGGWTENNEIVWSGPPDAVLRGVADLPRGSSRKLSPARVDKWLHARPNAWCAVDSTYFRWQRSFTEPELRAIINKVAAVGRIEEIILGERGVSGRLESVGVRGSRKTETFTRELAIRRAFGGLPSALFTVTTSTAGGHTRFTFVGGGRGHGVGLCQQGARGMALSGLLYPEILRHYYSGVSLTRCD